jgi:hypothetical protein
MRTKLVRVCQATVLGFLIGASVVFAQAAAIPNGASIYIEEMENDLDGYLRAEFVKKKVPLHVVLNREDAHLVLPAPRRPKPNESGMKAG